MALSLDLRRRAAPLVVPALGALLGGYFGYHALTGERSLGVWWHLRQQVEETDLRLGAVRAERERLGHRVSLLHSDSLDPDLLDESARRMLGLAAADEIVIFLAPDPASPSSARPRPR